MHTERYCASLDNLDRVKAIRAIQEALLQIAALDRLEPADLDFGPVTQSLASCLRDAGHIGFTETV